MIFVVYCHQATDVGFDSKNSRIKKQKITKEVISSFSMSGQQLIANHRSMLLVYSPSYRL